MPDQPRLCFEDLPTGSTMTYGGLAVSREDIVAFAREFDPQPFHVDEAAARETFVGGLIASGWHTCALLMRMIADGFLLESSSMGSPGIEETRWLKPVRPGDRLITRHTVLEARESKSRPDRGLVRFRFVVENQDGAAVLEQTNWILFARRGAEPLSRQEPTPAGPAPAPEPPPPAMPAPWFEDVAVGETARLGSHLFTADDIVRYARAFDPQAFHVDEEAARQSHFGGLCASGWHTAAAWMAAMVGHRTRARGAALAAGEAPAELGPSPGLRNLKWLRPVYAGDTITYSSTATDKRPSASRPGWGLVFHHNTGVNQHGETVFSFDGSVFWQRRG